jgi:hypothetical protein
MIFFIWNQHQINIIVLRIMFKAVLHLFSLYFGHCAACAMFMCQCRQAPPVPDFNKKPYTSHHVQRPVEVTKYFELES